MDWLVFVVADNLEVPKTQPISLSPLPAPADLRQLAETHSLKLATLIHARQKSTLENKKTGNNLLPAVNLEAGVASTRYGSSPFDNDAGSPARPSGTDPYIGIRFTYDLLARKDRMARAQTHLSLESNGIEKEKTLREIDIEVDNFIEAWKLDSARLAIRQTEIAIAEKSYAQAAAGYKIGTVDLLQRTKARNDLINARLNRLQAELNLKELEISIDQAIGKTLSKFGVHLP